ncbi:MAG: tetratricopeptide repeat protein, partial [Saprospiraceae bacterium]|nr:tetratricopeptide repeat protein [Saprospiraceae bacterium]
TYRDAGRYYGEQRGDLNRAVQYLEQARQLRPDDYETLRLLGVAYGIGGDQERAISFFNRAAELAPDNADAWFNLATAHLNAGNAIRAEEYLQRAKALDPGIVERRRREN